MNQFGVFGDLALASVVSCPLVPMTVMLSAPETILDGYNGLVRPVKRVLGAPIKSLLGRLDDVNWDF